MKEYWIFPDIQIIRVIKFVLQNKNSSIYIYIVWEINDLDFFLAPMVAAAHHLVIWYAVKSSIGINGQ